MRSFLIVAVGFLALSSTALPAAEPTGEKLLLGFEEEDFVRLDKAIKLTRQEGKTRRGEPYVAWQSPGGFAAIGQWLIFKGQASQGEHALGISLVTNRDYIVYSPTKIELPPEPVWYYGLLNNNWAAANGALFNTCGVFRRMFPADWSDYDLLRLDAYGLDVKQTIRIVLEDEEIGPPIVRNLTIEPGKWVTLEIDLRAAVKERGLDLARMATLAVGVSELHEKPKVEGQTTALIDNLRLAGAKTPATLPVVRDSTSHALPAYFKTSRPAPVKKPAGKPDRSPLKLDKPFQIDSDKPASVAPVGWVAAYDNQRLLVGYSHGMVSDGTARILLLQSLDGGQKWRGLDGGDKPTGLHVFNPDHGSGRGDVAGAGADVLLFNNLGCAGPNITSLRLFARKLTLGDKGWEVREMPALVDCDLRHCNSNHSIVRGPDGRLWGAYGMVGRLGTNCINLRYSDDDGLTWKSWAESKSGLVPGSLHSDKKGIGFGYTFEEPCLAPLGAGVACIWQERSGYDFVRLLWSHFDGQRWSPVEEIEQPKRTVSGSVTRPPIHAVSLGGKEIFLVSALFDGVLHYDGERWQTEPVEVPAGSRISAAGDKAIVVIGGDGKPVNKGPLVLRAWQRTSAGRWSGPVELAREDAPLSHKHDGVYVIRPGLVVQPYSPPNFVPVAWTCEGKNWVRVLRVPVADDEIDWVRARKLHDRVRQGEKLSGEDEAYYKRAKALVDAGQGPGRTAGGAPGAPTPKENLGLIPLTELGKEKYKGEVGGLYGSGSNEPPASHLALAKSAAAKIVPLDAAGRPDKAGKIVLLSIGMSNTTQEYSRFVQLANADRRKSRDVVLVDGAQGGQAAVEWADPKHLAGREGVSTWDVVERRLKSAGVTASQVQAVWLKQALIQQGRYGEFPKHAEKFAGELIKIIQMAKERYPNLRIIYLSSRIYAGYANGNLNPEPYAYEGAFAVRNVIFKQIGGDKDLNCDPTKDDVKAPVLLWGPYLWADGTKPRKSDDLVYTRDDLARDGTHPSDSGRDKVARQLLEFFTSDVTAKDWFVAKK